MCDALDLVTCSVACDCIACFRNETFVGCVQVGEAYPSGTDAIQISMCNWIVVVILVYLALSVLFLVVAFILVLVRTFGASSAMRTNGQLRWFLMNLAFVNTTLTIFCLPVVLIVFHVPQTVDEPSRFMTALTMLALCVVLLDILRMLEHADSHGDSGSRFLQCLSVVLMCILLGCTVMVLTIICVLCIHDFGELVTETVSVVDIIVTTLIVGVAALEYAYLMYNYIAVRALEGRAKLAAFVTTPFAVALASFVWFLAAHGDSRLAAHLFLTAAAFCTSRFTALVKRAFKWQVKMKQPLVADPLRHASVRVNAWSSFRNTADTNSFV
jgi:hypothetical protein